MSVVAWRDGVLCADKQGSVENMIYTADKCFRGDDGAAIAWVGLLSTGYELLSWYNKGRLPEDWPVIQKSEEDWAIFIVANCGKCVFYEKAPHPIQVTDGFMAWGSGGGLAIGAMEMGATAEQAVNIACRRNSGCGRGITILEAK